MATKTRQLADFLVAGGVSDAEIQSVPHIRPGILQPAVAGKLLNGATHSGAYGTAQTQSGGDGHSYYYTDIKGSKPIKDPRIGSHFGSQRHKTTSVQLLEQETATHGENVYSVDGREWMRYVAPNLESFNNEHGTWFQIGSVTTGTNWLEITGYFNAVNWSALLNSSTSDVNLAIDGTANSSVFTGGSNSVLTPLGSRYVNASSLISLIFDSTPTLGIHTVKISNVSGDYFRLWGIELIAQDTSSTANKSKIQIPAQNVVSYGKKFTVSGTPHYNPFAFKTDGTTAWTSGNHNGTAWPIGTGSSTNIDTATSLGLENWKHGDNYYYPYNGGRVVKWVDSSGTIKTSVNMMPPNAQNIAGSAVSAKANASVANDTYLPTFSGAIDHSQAEVAKTFHNREFGNGNANGGTSGTWADASMLTGTQGSKAFVMDDGLTSLSGVLVRNSTGTTQNWTCYTDGYWYLIFIGTGFSQTSSYNSVENYTIAQNLPYGTHILKVLRDGDADPAVTLDGVSLGSIDVNNYGDLLEATIYQPKMPPIPEDAVVLADYMLMADFVVQTAGTVGHISKGVRSVSSTRDFFYDGVSLSSSLAISFSTGSISYGIKATSPNLSAGDDTATYKLPYFGTDFIVHHYANRTGTLTENLNSDAGTATAISTSAFEGHTKHIGNALGLNEIKNHHANGVNDAEMWTQGCQIATPIHTSHHYTNTHESPYLMELIGGDRNMEQNNLIVTPDGQTWDEVTRDTSYLGKARVRAFSLAVMALTDNTTWFNWAVRGGTVDSSVAEGEKRGAFYNKDFAVAYDRFICLKDGQYIIHSMQTTSQNTDLLINGAVFQAMTAAGEATTESLSVPVNLKRGDYIQKVGGYNNPSDNEWSSFEIWSL